MNEMYSLINNKDESFYHFIKFMDFMIENVGVKFKDKQMEKDYWYHYYKIPGYLRESLEKIRHETINDIASISMVTNRMFERINKLTNLSKGE